VNSNNFYNAYVSLGFNKRVILLNLVHAGNLQFLAIFHNFAANEQVFLHKTSKISINTPKYLKYFLILLEFPCFFLIIQLLLIAVL